MNQKSAEALGGTAPFDILNYIRIARPDHWFKNIFMLPGTATALLLANDPGVGLIVPFVLGIVSTCLIASANYTINEWLDADFDRFHPVKKHRPCVSAGMSRTLVYVQYALLSIGGLALAMAVSMNFAVFSLILLIMGVFYNVPPLRYKDRAYLDVLTESVNNPLRFMLGWSIVIADQLPPSSILLAYWMGGAFLMAIKRYAEYRSIGDETVAGSYRKSFIYYTEQSLLASAFFYSICASFFLAIFLIKYRIEFLVTFPFFAILFTWYLMIGMRKDSASERPETLFKEKRFMAYVAFLCLLIAGLFFIDLPWLSYLNEAVHY